MPLLNRLSLLPLASSFFLRLAIAGNQTCYYPDGVTVSTDVPCSTGAESSSCCPSDSFCMGNGLCFKAGITSRGSCTDQDWTSEECAAYCTTTNRSTAVSLTPCDADTNTFACGLNNTYCQHDQNTFTITSGTSLVLRESQIAALLTNTDYSKTNSGKTYSAGAMAGLAFGLLIPLLTALTVALLMLRKERRRNGPKLMYRPADEPGVQLSSMQPKHSFALSRNESVNTIDSTSKSYYRNYTYKNPFAKNPFASDGDLGVPVYEIGSSSPPYSEQERAEAPDKRFSK